MKALKFAMYDCEGTLKGQFAIFGQNTFFIKCSNMGFNKVCNAPRGGLHSTKSLYTSYFPVSSLFESLHFDLVSPYSSLK